MEGQEQPPEPPIRETLTPPTESSPAIPPFEPLLDEPMAVEPVPEPAPRGPIGASERERYAARAAAICKQGRLTLGAYAELVEVFQETEEREDFDRAVQLVRQAESQTAIVPATTTAPMIAVFSGNDRKGSMHLPPSTTAVAVFGSVDLDLGEATVSGDVTTIRAYAALGGVDVRVPPGVRVESQSIPILGSTDVKLKGPPPRADAPIVRFELVAFLGGADVTDRGRWNDPVKSAVRLAGAFGPGSTDGIMEARVRIHEARREAHRAAREARREAHRAARAARHGRPR